MANKSSRRLTEQERAERRRQDRERLQQAARELLSSEGWARWVRTRAMFHSYSALSRGRECQPRWRSPLSVGDMSAMGLDRRRRRRRFSDLQVRAAFGAPRGAALRDMRVADGDQQLQRQLPLRRHEREPCQRRAAVKADRVEEMVLDALRGYSATADVHGRASRKQQIREADEAIERANVDLDETIRQLGELGLLGRPASQAPLEKLATGLDDAHTVRARLGNGGESNVIGPDDIDKLREPAKRLAAWRRLITDTIESVTVAPAMTADGRHSRRRDPRRIDIRFLGQHP
jgi:hypothetical protein